MKKALLCLQVATQAFCLAVPAMSAGPSYTWAELQADLQVKTRGNLDLSDSIWLELANMGIERLSSEAPAAVGTVGVYLVADQAAYSLPDDFIKLCTVFNKATWAVHETMKPNDPGKAGTGMDQ